MNPYSLDDLYILVTGAAGNGVGAGVCEAVVEAGGILVANERSSEACNQVCERYPGSVPAPGGISKETDVIGLFGNLEKQGVKLDGLVNNAGVGLSRPSYLATAEEFDHVFDVDVRGLWMMTRAFVEHCRRHQKPGHVVNVSSVHVMASIRNYAIYTAAKGAVEAYTRTAAIELAEFGMRMNAIAPGYVHSEQNLDLIATWAEDPSEWVDHHRKYYQAIPSDIKPIECGRAAVFLIV